MTFVTVPLTLVSTCLKVVATPFTISLPVVVVVSVMRSLILPELSLTFSARVWMLVVTVPSAFCAVVVAVLEMDEMTVSVVDLEPDFFLPEEPLPVVTMELPPLPLAAANSACRWDQLLLLTPTPARACCRKRSRLLWRRFASAYSSYVS